jgi:hypothetical protein
MGECDIIGEEEVDICLKLDGGVGLACFRHALLPMKFWLYCISLVFTHCKLDAFCVEHL